MNDNTLFRLNRRQMVAGTLATGLALATGSGIARAQDDSATPETGDDGTTESASDTTAAIERATEAITAAQADRDAVATQIDATTVDELLTQATSLRDRAQQAVGSGDDDEAWRLARAAIATAKAADGLVKAQLITGSVPSQEAPASRILANAHEAITEVGEDAAAASDADASAAITTAQALYQTAYDLFTAGEYGQAARTARVAAGMAFVAAWLLSPNDLPGRGRRRARRDERRDRRRDGDGDATDDTPVEVPEPTF